MGFRAYVLLLLLACATVRQAGASQIVSPISRLRSDMRSVSIAIEAYRIDAKGAWPPLLRGTSQLNNRFLTTPVAYMQPAPDDYFTRHVMRKRPFFLKVGTIEGCVVAIVVTLVVRALLYLVDWKGKKSAWVFAVIAGALPGNMVAAFLREMNGSSTWTWQNDSWKSGATSFHFHVTDAGAAVLQSLGPDGDLDMTVADFDAASSTRTFAPFEYDPTNGIASGGDIIRVLE